MFSRFFIAALVASFAVACGSPITKSTLGSNEGDSCPLNQPGTCGDGLECYVPPGCSGAICCPPQNPSNPVCYCSLNEDAGPATGDASQSADATTTD
jgi:hypothetical protein